jgi:hypothetical protein
MRVLVLWLACLPVFAAGASVDDWRNATLFDKVRAAEQWVIAVNAETHMLGRSPSEQSILEFAGSVVSCVDEFTTALSATGDVVPYAAICIDILSK